MKQGILHSIRKVFLLFLMLGSLSSFSLSSFADSSVSEYQVKAAFLYHFLQFVEWPHKETYSIENQNSNNPYIIGVLGKNPFGSDLQKTLRNKLVNKKTVQIKYIQKVEELKECHVLFISASEKANLSTILQELQGSSVLTISDMEGFNEKGGMINFILMDQKVRFSINSDAAKSAGLNISSRLLQPSLNNTPNLNNPERESMPSPF